MNGYEFTYALFDKLSRDFNGDIFPEIDEEFRIIEGRHLKLLQDMLFGNTGLQMQLFLSLYQFDIIPIDLISSIYEEFLHSSPDESERSIKKRQDGAYYTPLSLVEFVLSKVLKPETIEKNPRVIDPACGSGIFLVEAFRRIVRYQTHKKRKPLTLKELKQILKDQITGIEVNPEAASISAFSLYLSMLHYLKPPDILHHISKGDKLPCLVGSNTKSDNHYNCILPINAFDDDSINANPQWRNRFHSGCADIIIGNPPWGGGGVNTEPGNRESLVLMYDWLEKNNKRPIGNNESSQAFVWRAIDLLNKNGSVGMLVSYGVLFNHSSRSREFRRQWTNSVQLTQVYNFAHVRNVFFKATSPFVAVFFQKSNQNDHPVYYWSAKQSSIGKEMQVVLFSRSDLNVLRDVDLSDHKTWKIFLWGHWQDEKFMSYLRRIETLSSFTNRKDTGQGFKIASMDEEALELQRYQYLPIEEFKRYGNLDSFIEAPKRVHRSGVGSVYEGPRLLVEKGICQKAHTKGIIIARYETTPFCFTHALYGIKLKEPEEWKYKVILGILWSSLSRYYFFLSTAKWGLWHYEIYLDNELLQLPIVLNKKHSATQKVIDIVDKLRNYHPNKLDIMNTDGVPEREIEAKRRNWEAELDKAVFKLYNLDEAQIDLIRDLCEVTLQFFYDPINSPGSKMAVEKNDFSWIERYVKIFCYRWNVYLENNEEMRAKIHVGANGNMVAVEFFPANSSEHWDLKPESDSWSNILDKIGDNNQSKISPSQIVLDGIVHVVSDYGIIIIKRNNKRFWTRSLAREDAEATLCKRMFDTMPESGGLE